MAKSKPGSVSYVVKESRMFRGRMFNAGDVFDPKAADCSEAEAATWHSQGLLMTAEEFAATIKVDAAEKTEGEGEKTEGGDAPK